MLALPLIAGWIGRNYFYGFRSRRTLESDAIWYPVNRVTGVLLLAAGLMWLAAGIAVGLVAIGVATLGAAAYLRWLVASQRE